jgi:hypothetical protein
MVEDAHRLALGVSEALLPRFGLVEMRHCPRTLIEAFTQ